MKKKQFVFVVILFLIVMLSAGCTSKDNDVATVSANPDSDFVATFNKLNLGNLFDFEFKLPEAENKWVYLWVESYVNGVKEPDPLISLGFGSSPDEKIQDNIGFTMISLSSEETYVFLYGPGVSGRRKIEHGLGEDVFNSLEYAISNKTVGIELGEEKLLAVYRETKSNSIQSLNFDDEQVVEKAIEKSDLVYLLKIIIEEE